MSKKKKRRTVSLGSIPGATPTEEPAEQPTQPDAAPSSPPARQRTAAARTTARPTRASNTTSELQLDPTGRRNYFVRWFDALNDFWFTPRSPRMLGVIRILTGVLLLYSLAVWTLELSTFLRPTACCLRPTVRPVLRGVIWIGSPVRQRCCWSSIV